MYRHGDLILIPSDQEPPATARPTRSLVLAEGEETGHKHVLTGDVIGWSVFAKISKGPPTRVAQREALAPLIASAEGILFSEALAAEGAVMFPKANWALRGSCRSDGAASIRAGEAAIGSRP
jgi:hypothetical protein